MLSEKIYNYNEKKNLVFVIEQINDRRIYIKLFKFLLEEDILYNKNSNGVFFNLSKLSDNKLKKLETFVNNYHLFDESETFDNSEKSEDYQAI